MDLAQYLNGPLSNEHKIPVSNHYMAAITQSGVDPEALSRAEAEALFRASEHETAGFATIFVKPVIAFPPLEDTGTESSFHSFWDQNIRNFLTCILKARAIRDGNERGSTPLQRPDFGLLVNGICIFRGEEKAPSYSGKHPKTELLEKVTWTYGSAPYLLGKSSYP